MNNTLQWIRFFIVWGLVIVGFISVYNYIFPPTIEKEAEHTNINNLNYTVSNSKQIFKNMTNISINLTDIYPKTFSSKWGNYTLISTLNNSFGYYRKV